MIAVTVRVLSSPLEALGWTVAVFTVGVVAGVFLARRLSSRFDRRAELRSVDEWQAWQREQRRRAS